MNTYFISDLHLGHKGCLNFDNRPFDTIEEQDEQIINNWNNKVKSRNDIVYILGDISWYKAEKTVEIFKKLNGMKYLIVGNHDKKLLKNKIVRELFQEIIDYKEIRYRDISIVLCHYPIPCFNGHYRGGFHFYGHVHNSFEWDMMEKIKSQMPDLYNNPCNMFNVGCMIPYMNYTPKTFEEITSSEDK